MLHQAQSLFAYLYFTHYISDLSSRSQVRKQTEEFTWDVVPSLMKVGAGLYRVFWQKLLGRFRL